MIGLYYHEDQPKWHYDFQPDGTVIEISIQSGRTATYPSYIADSLKTLRGRWYPVLPDPPTASIDLFEKK